MRVNHLNFFDPPFKEGCFDHLIIILKNIFLKRLKTKSCDIEYDFTNLDIGSRPSYQLLKLGCDCINQGIFPHDITLLSDAKIAEFLRSNNISNIDIVELNIVKHAIISIQDNDFEAFYSTISVFVFDRREIADLVDARPLYT